MNDIKKQEALVALRKYRLNQISEENLVELRSFSNNVWKVNAKGQNFVLRRYSKISYANLVHMNNNIIYLIGLGIPIPGILRNADGLYATCISDCGYDLSDYMPHVELKYPEMNITDNQIGQAANLLSKINAVSLTQLPSPLIDKSDKEVDFKSTLKLISEFQLRYQEFIDMAAEEEKIKIYNLNELINLTNNNREVFIDQGGFSLGHLPKALSQGDFSLSNLLPTISDNIMYIVDWENMGLRTRAWELHRSLLLICGKGYCNANFDELDFRRATIFLDVYLRQVHLEYEEIILLPKIAEYISFFHWIRFTLESVMRGDNRILERIPKTIEKGLWWKRNSSLYNDWIFNYFNYRVNI
jgi:hypothetical protein